MTDNEEITINLGNEYDSRLRDAIARVVRDMGGQIDNKVQGMAGSQELEVVWAEIDDRLLVIETETYIGISLRGKRTLVEDVAKRVRAYMLGEPWTGGSPTGVAS